LSTLSIVAALKVLDSITAADRARVGGKAFNCARLKQAGFPVPDGLVVPADATEEEIARLFGHPWFHSVPEATLLAVRSVGGRTGLTRGLDRLLDS